MGQLTKNFSLEEMTASATAKAKGIDNTPPSMVREHLQVLANGLQSLRDYYGKGIAVNCAYRCKKLNDAVGGATTSQHMTGYAADIRPTDGNMSALKMSILAWANTHQYDQIIFEQCDAHGIPAWIHLGIRHVAKGQRRQKLTAKKINGKWNYSVYK